MTESKKTQLENLTLLGNQATVYPTDYSPAVLETFKK